MSIDLHKKAEKVGISLKKNGINNPPIVEVSACWDISGSMQGRYFNGEVQEALNHVLGLAMAFDPSHKLKNFVFDDRWAGLDVMATPNNYQNYIRDQVLNEDKIPKWSGTEYAEVIHGVQDFHFGKRQGGGFFSMFRKKQSETAKAVGHRPVINFFFTDGDNQDRRAAEEAFQRASEFPIFFCLIGLGRGSSFSFLKYLDKTEPDCEFVDLSNLNISDEALYAKIMTPKLITWLRQHPERAAA